MPDATLGLGPVGLPCILAHKNSELCEEVAVGRLLGCREVAEVGGGGWARGPRPRARRRGRETRVARHRQAEDDEGRGRAERYR